MKRDPDAGASREAIMQKTSHLTQKRGRCSFCTLREPYGCTFRRNLGKWPSGKFKHFSVSGFPPFRLETTLTTPVTPGAVDRETTAGAY